MFALGMLVYACSSLFVSPEWDSLSVSPLPLIPVCISFGLLYAELHSVHDCKMSIDPFRSDEVKNRSRFCESGRDGASHTLHASIEWEGERERGREKNINDQIKRDFMEPAERYLICSFQLNSLIWLPLIIVWYTCCVCVRSCCLSV